MDSTPNPVADRDPHRRRHRRDEGARGAASIVVSVIVVVTLVMCAGLVRVAEATVDRARADATADLVALAAVGAGRDAADRVAAANSAMVHAYIERADGAVQVRIERGGSTSRAAAAPHGAPLGHVPRRGQR